MRAVTLGAKGGDAGVLHGELLSRFAEAAVGGSAAELATARDALRASAGGAAVVDAAAVIGNFQRMVRIADGAGIVLDGVMQTLSEDFRDEIGLESFATRRGESIGTVSRLLGPLLRSAAKVALRTAGWRARRRV